MKNFKEFLKDFNKGMTSTATDMSLAYAAYCQGYAEGMKENLNNMLSATITMPTTFPLPEELTRPTCDTQAQLLHEEAEKMQVYPEQLVKEYSPEELKELQRGLKINGIMSEKDLNEYMAEHTRK